VKQIHFKQLIDEQPQRKAKYLRISAGLRLAINQGLLVRGEQLPAARELGQQLSSNRHTIMAAYDELIAEGWIYSQQRKGYFVADVLPITRSQNASTNHTMPRVPFQWRFTKTLHPVTNQQPASYRYNFAGGIPDTALFPFAEFRTHTNEALNHPDMISLNYGDNAGFKPLIEQISLYLRRVRSLKDREIVITNGSQEALYILAQILISPGDSVATEAMGYRPAWNAFSSAGANLVAIAQDENGIIPESLSEAVISQQGRGCPIKLLYLTPLHQYPTTVTLPIPRRQAIYRIAQQYHIAIIEDDYDHEFHYRCQPLAPMASDDPQGLVIYLSTFSKVMFPGARIGFMAVDTALRNAIVSYKTIINHKVNITTQDAIARWMTSGNFERYLRKITKVYQQRRDFMLQQLAVYQQRKQIKSFTSPDGGMAIWVELDHSAQQFASRAKSNDIFVQSQRHFTLEPQDDNDRFIRLGFAGMDQDKIEKGLACLFDHKND